VSQGFSSGSATVDSTGISFLPANAYPDQVWLLSIGILRITYIGSRVVADMLEHGGRGFLRLGPH